MSECNRSARSEEEGEVGEERGCITKEFLKWSLYVVERMAGFLLN